MFSSQVCKWPPETLLGARPFGPRFHQVPSVSLPQDAWGPIPVHHRVCFFLYFGVTHEISFAKKGSIALRNVCGDHITEDAASGHLCKLLKAI